MFIYKTYYWRFLCQKIDLTSLKVVFEMARVTERRPLWCTRICSYPLSLEYQSKTTFLETALRWQKAELVYNIFLLLFQWNHFRNRLNSHTTQAVSALVQEMFIYCLQWKVFIAITMEINHGSIHKKDMYIIKWIFCS